ncbi:MAG: pyridoxamine 5'-phosphate oxidase family protein [bacterium]
MNQSIEQVKKFVQHHPSLVLIGTADRRGFPHLAMEMGVQWVKERTMRFESWFCLSTIKNLKENPKVAVAIFDQQTQKGYQMLGRIESIHEAAILNGYIPGEKPDEHGIPPQAYRIDIAIEEVLFFSSGPHSDGPLP